MNHSIVAVPTGKTRKAPILSVIILLSLLIVSCDPENNKLGVDIFPPSDTMQVYTDTIRDMEAMLVTSRPRVTSITPSINNTETRLHLLGSMVDTITGFSKAEIVTEFGLIRGGAFGENPLIDSLSIALYVEDIYGDTTQQLHITIYELYDDLVADSSYKSDYDITGKYNPTPLLDETFVPKPNSVYEFELDNPELLERIYTASNPEDSVFFFNADLQEHFPGLYITTEAVSSGGGFAKLNLGNSLAGLKFKYYHDSLNTAERDTLPISNYNIGFSPASAQKFNIFHHDFTGTPLADVIDDPAADPSIGYAQGMAGVNMKIQLPDIRDYVGDGSVAINAARLVFYVLPDSLSGISEPEYPKYLMMETEYQEDTFNPLYDFVISSSRLLYGQLQQSNESSAFLAPKYFYNFNIGRHLQSVLSGEIENKPLYIFVNDPATTPNVIKFWSNYSGREGGLRLELIYTKF